jgi:hypothetical protein
MAATVVCGGDWGSSTAVQAVRKRERRKTAVMRIWG